MRTAKEIIEEYRARGYGMESLRVLADSRDEPLRSEMLALLSRENEGGGEAAADDMVFFLVSEDEGVEEVGGDIIDFDILASDAGALARDPSFLAAEEESVAELAIGDDEGTAFVRLDAEGREIILGQPLQSDHFGQAVIEAGSPPYEAPEEARTPEAATIDEPEQVDGEPPVVAEENAGETESADTEKYVGQTGETSDLSSDYLPGSAAAESVEEAEPAVEPVALETAAETPVERPEEPLVDAEETENVDMELLAAELPQIDAAAEALPREGEPLPPLEQGIFDLAFPITADKAEQKESSSERRRRRREERKRAKAEKKLRSKAKKAAEKLEHNLPEIVLSSTEGTETLSEEPCRDIVLSSPALDFPADEEGEGSAASLMIPAGVNFDLSVAEMREESLCGDATKAVELQSMRDESGLSVSHGILSALGGGDAVDENFDVEGEGAESCDERNVIRLYDATDDKDDGAWAADGTEENSGIFSGNLFLLENTIDTATPEAVEDSAPELSPMARIGLLRALTGGESPACEFYDMTEETVNLGDDHVIVQPGAEAVAAPEMDEAIIAELEKDYQSRLDEFAKRLLEMQTIVAESETQYREKSRALSEKERETADLSAKLRSGEEAIRGMTADMATLSDDLAKKSGELDALNGLKDEHTRLYGEFEDLRGAYNEVVTNVMPALQNERDELVEAVERQSEDEDNLRRALKTTGRRMAVGYSLAAAAAVMMVALPLTHWLAAGGSEQRLALGHQKASELNERLDKAERRNVEAEKIIFDLQQQSNLAKLELAKLENANHELSQLSDKRTREVAQLKANLSGGGSTRTALEAGDNLGMNGPVGRDGKLRVNEVRDPGGSIEKVLADNRERFAREDAASVMASASANNASRTNLQVSAVATRAPEQAAGRAQDTRKPAAGQTVAVKKGEGVAQVVYRVLGTRDPQVIAWVIKENNLKMDKKGNPKIFPEQKLVLPSGGERSLNQASAAKR